MLQELNNYKNPRDKLAHMVKKKECIPVIQGLYETNPTTPGYRLANTICSPSYLSFEFALSYHGLIPEAVYNFTSATFEKKQKRKIVFRYALRKKHDAFVNKQNYLLLKLML